MTTVLASTPRCDGGSRHWPRTLRSSSARARESRATNPAAHPRRTMQSLCYSLKSEEGGLMPMARNMSRLPVCAAICLAILSASHVTAQEFGWLGVVITDLTPAESSKLGTSSGGAYVIEVKNHSPADLAGLLSRDIVLMLNGKTIAGVQDLACSLAGTRPGDVVRLTLMRGKQLRTITATLSGWPSGALQRPTHLADCGISLLEIARRRTS
jgi:PDZ domain-containing protein